MKKLLLALVLLTSNYSYAQSAQAPVVTTINPLEGLKFFGDVRYRYDLTDYEGSSERKYQRLRARFGLKSTPTDTSQLEFRLATGAGRTSTNQQLGDSANGENYTIRLDRANIKITEIDKVELTFGRFGSVFVAAGGSDLLFDSDLNFDGISAKNETKFDLFDLTSSLSHYAIDSNSAGNSVNLSAAQIAAKFKMENDAHVLFHASYFYYDNIKDHTAMGGTGVNGFNGNSNTGAGGVYTQDYRLVNLGLEYKMKLSGKSFVVFTEAVKNEAADNEEMGYIAGVKFGGLKNKSDWSVGYDYRVLEKDSTFGAFADGESFGGGVNGKGHRLQAGYQFGTNWSLSTSVFVGEKNIASGETSAKRDRILFDLSAWF